MRPKKSLGQNFLQNTDILSVMVESARLTQDSLVVEVGPGKGSLTDLLIATGAQVIAVEKDDELARALSEKYRDMKNLEIIHGDILAYSPPKLPYTLIGNIPYYLTSHLLRTVLESWPAPQTIVFMVQKEVAQRIVAMPPKMSMLAVMVQYYAAAKMVRTVKRGSFSPPPKVDSAILQLIPHSQSLSIAESRQFLDMVRRGFDQPRRMMSAKLPQTVLIEAGIDPRRRAETLSINEWKSIFEVFIKTLSV